jgi:hypothetical protein
MRFIYILLTLTIVGSAPTLLYAQSNGGDFPFGRVSMEEMTMKNYPRDTSATAVVLKEYGYAWISDQYKVVLERHIKMKVFTEAGKDKVDVVLYLYRNGNVASDEEVLASFQAVTYNQEGASIQKTVMDQKSLIVEKTTRELKTIKIVFPNVKAGSVVELAYRTESPYLYLFKTWYFQHDIPTLYSEFWSKIPANFSYNMTLRGGRQLKAQNVERITKCFSILGSSGYDSFLGDCSLGKYLMVDIPAFEYEEYLSSDANYRSSIYFELSEYVDVYGVKQRFAETWKDIYVNLKDNEYFGVKLKRGRKFMEGIVPALIKPDMDDLAKAATILNHISGNITWNQEVDKYAASEIKKVYEDRKGNSAEVNLALIAALDAAGLVVQPVLLSTRSNGIPNKKIPQRRDFDYVIAKVTIAGKDYLLDATDPTLQMGMIPFECQNGEGLLFDPTGTFINLGTGSKLKLAIRVNLAVSESGQITGNVSRQHHGYAALNFVKERQTTTEEKSLAELQAEVKEFKITNYKATESKRVMTEPHIETFDIELENHGNNPILYLNPFVYATYPSNPFKAERRTYPVDFGVLVDVSYFVTITLPPNFTIEDLPASNLVALPNNGGRALVNTTLNANKATVSFVVSLTKPVYSVEEYPALKAFFDKVVAYENGMLALKKVDVK